MTMIDWFPPRAARPATEAPARHLARWQGLVNLRRVARAIDAKDPATAGHSDRVAELARRVAREAGWEPRRVEPLVEAATIHDVGKLAVPEGVLLAPPPITPDDYELLKMHAHVGAQVAATVLGAHQVAWVRHHHERWDGRGYPDGIAGEDIPEGAAILAVADAWDAMTHRPLGGGALAEAEALEECRREAGRQFAPWAVAALERAILRPDPAEAPLIAPLRLVPLP